MGLTDVAQGPASEVRESVADARGSDLAKVAKALERLWFGDWCVARAKKKPRCPGGTMAAMRLIRDLEDGDRLRSGEAREASREREMDVEMSRDASVIGDR